MSKSIWIINQYASLPSTGIGGRHRDLSRELAKRGHNVTLISARWTHLVRDARTAEKAPDTEWFEGFRFVRIPVRKYEHAHDKRRILNWFSFAFKVARLPRNLSGRPDVVLYSSPSLIGFLGARCLARKVSAKLIFEVRDIWPLTFQEVGGYSLSHPFIKFMQWIEDYAYRSADFVVSNLQGAHNHMNNRGLPLERFKWIPNGFSLKDVADPEPLPEEVVTKIPKDGFRVCYAGSMGTANALDSLLDAAALLKEDKDISFILVGNGRSKKNLKQKALQLGIERITFLDALPKNQVQSFIAQCDACFIGWKNSRLYEYGIAANKLFDYLYSGKPILHAYSGKFDPVEEYGAGFTVPAESPRELVAAIRKLRDMGVKERALMGGLGKKAVIERHEYSVLAKSYDEIFDQ